MLHNPHQGSGKNNFGYCSQMKEDYEYCPTSSEAVYPFELFH